MHLKVRVFAGMRPQKSVDLLQPGEAVTAVNTRLTGGDLEPYRGLGVPGAGVTFAGAPVLSMYRFGQLNPSEVQFWLQSAVDADYVKAMVDGDTTERTFWTDGIYCKKTNATLATGSAPYPTSFYRAGIPAPAGTPTVTVTGTPTRSADPVETVIYCYTYVSVWGEEGPPSPASAYARWQPGQTLNVSGMSSAPTGNYNITGKRLYRSATGTSGTQFQLVNTTDLSVAVTGYTDTATTSTLSEALITTGWVEPPDNMLGLCAMANGIMAGFFANTVCFSEPFLPYAWPVKYQMSVDAPIVGIAAFDQSLFVGTTQGVYIITGTDPASMSSLRLPVAQSCVSKRSIVSMMGGVLFASPDGLFQVTATGIVGLSADLMTRVDWQAYNPSSISAYESDNKYIAFYNNGTAGAMIFSFGDSPTFSLTDIYATAGYRDKQRDALYLCVGNVLKKWDALGAAVLTYDWLSGVFHLPNETNMSCARVNASAYPVTFKLWADGALMCTTTVNDGYPFRLPSGYRSMRYQIELTGTPLVREVVVANSMHELTAG